MLIDLSLTRRGFLGTLSAPVLLAQTTPAAASSLWNGYEKRDFMIGAYPAYVVLPRIAAPGKPWFWRARFPDYQPRPALGLLSKGFHLAYLDLPNTFGNPPAVAAWEAFYDHVVLNFGLASKMSLEGISRGALFVYNWAAKHAERVNAIYCESPVCDLKSWPGGKGKGLGSAKDWQEAMAAFNLSEAQMLAFNGNPIGETAPLAARKIPILHVVSDRDQLVPPAENTDVFAERYQRAGGPIEVYRNTGMPDALSGHHFPLDDPDHIVNFILAHTPGMERAATGLTPHGREYFQLRGGLRNAWRRFQAGGDARVVFLGGSITQMAGWRDLVCRQLTARFPQTKFDFVNAGISSTGSTPGAFRLLRDVFARGPVDLLFEEAAVNDSTNFFPPREQVRGMEGIVRHARLVQPELDIVLLHFVDPDKMTELRAGRTPQEIASHERVATHYGLPSIDLAREITERIDAGEFTWENDFKNLHPSPFGMSVYARSIERLFDAAWKQPPMIEGAAQAHPLPAALDARSYFRGRLVNIAEAKGWRIDPDWTPRDQAATRAGFVHVPMLIGETPDEECRFAFEGTAVGIFVAAGPDAGIVEFQIDGGPWRQSNLRTNWSATLHIPWAYVLDADLNPGQHELVMRVSAGAARIAHLMAN
jgi:pimeloyl-ACP methyl ester carboxylesterase/lysophospholipase L1-like esterase